MRSAKHTIWQVTGTVLTASLALSCTQDGLLVGNSEDNASELFFFPATLAEPIRVLSQTDDDVVAEVTAGGMILSDETLDGKTYSRLRVKGFSSAARTGYPEIPSVAVMVSVPRGMTLVYEILERDAGEERRLTNELAFQHRLPFHNGKTVYAKADPAAYAVSHGVAPVEILDVSYAATDKIATIRFNPVMYDPARKLLKHTRRMKVHFQFKAGASLADDAPPVGGESSGIMRALTLNSESGSPTRGSYANKLDLLIAHESHREALARYVQFKKQRGRDVKEHYVSGKTAQQIKEIIRTEYRSGTPPATTMLVGNIDQIPAHNGSGDNSWTDFPYQTLDGGGKPDVALGRVPAHNADELNAFIDKAIARETQARKYDEILMTAGTDVSLGCPANVKVVGDKFRPAGQAINIVQKFRSEGASTEDVIGAYNASPNVIVYDGHGYQQGMSEIPLLIKDLGRLTNTSFPIILDIACLNANWQGGASARNFAESILLKRGGGAAGIMASGGSGYGHDYFQTIASLMADGRKAVGDGGRAMNEIGVIIMAAKARHGEEDKAFWNYYGDPASSAWEPDTAPGNGGGNPPPTSPGGNPPPNPQPGVSPQPGANPPPPSGSSVYAAIGAGDAAAVLWASAPGVAKGMSYCIGAKTVCSGPSAKWLGMTKAKAEGGIEIYAGRATMALSVGLVVTIYAQMQDGRDLFQEISVKQK